MEASLADNWSSRWVKKRDLGALLSALPFKTLTIYDARGTFLSSCSAKIRFRSSNSVVAKSFPVFVSLMLPSLTVANLTPVSH